MSSRRRRESRDSRSSSNSRTRNRPRYQSPSATGARNWVRRERDDVGSDRRWKDDRERGRDDRRYDDRNRPAPDRERYTIRRSTSRSRSRSLRRSRSRSRSRYADRRDDRRSTHGGQNYDAGRRDVAERVNDTNSRWNQRAAKNSSNDRGATGNAQKSRKTSQKVSVASCGDWEAYLSSAGKAYFYNVIEQRSTWTKPAAWTAEADEQMNAAIASAAKQQDITRTDRSAVTSERDRDRNRDRDRDQQSRDWRNDTRRRSIERQTQRTRDSEKISRDRASPRTGRNNCSDRNSRDRQKPVNSQTARAAHKRRRSSSHSRSRSQSRSPSRERDLADSDSDSVSSSLVSSSLRSDSSSSSSRSASLRSRSPERHTSEKSRHRLTSALSTAKGTSSGAARERDVNTSSKSALDATRRTDTATPTAPTLAAAATESVTDGNGTSGRTQQSALPLTNSNVVAQQRFAAPPVRSVPQSPTPHQQTSNSANVTASPNLGTSNSAASATNSTTTRNVPVAFAQPQPSTNSPNISNSSSNLLQSNAAQNTNTSAINAPSVNNTSHLNVTAPSTSTSTERPVEAAPTQIPITPLSYYISSIMQATALPEYRPASATQDILRYFDERLISSVVETLTPAIAIEKAADAISQRSRERDEATYLRLCVQFKLAETRARHDQLRVAVIDSRVAEYKLNASAERSLSSVQQQSTSTGW